MHTHTQSCRWRVAHLEGRGEVKGGGGGGEEEEAGDTTGQGQSLSRLPMHAHTHSRDAGELLTGAGQPDGT